MGQNSVADLLAEASRVLARAHVDSPHLDGELLLAHVLEVDRSWLMAHPRALLSSEQVARWHTLLARRVAREPLAYIIGQRWFYDSLLHVTPAVLIPRPETEELVERALAWLQTHPRAQVADIGTGSGAIALMLAKHAANAHILATDISAAALDVARGNAQQLQLASRITFLQGDLLAPLPGAVDLLIANLPYVRQRDRAGLTPEVRVHEPALALFSGPEGLNHLQRFLTAAPRYLNPGGCILLEIGYDQGDVVAALAARHFPRATITIHQDLSGHPRIVEIT
jgi:release factor glutamine methyltransferase